LSYRGVKESDKPGLSCPVVPDDQVTSGAQLRFEELVRSDRTVREVSRRQPRAPLKPPEIARHRWNQDDREMLA
jgi:hypothetical protein